MKTIFSYLQEKLVIRKSGNKREITFEMLFDALNNMKRAGLRLADIWLPDKRPILPELDNEKRVAGWQITALYCRINGLGEELIYMDVTPTYSSHNSSLVRLTPENLYEVFSNEDLEKIYKEAIENGK